MKNYFFILLALFCTATVQAQIQLDARVGVNLSGMTETDRTDKFGLKVGIGPEYGFSDLFALRSGLFFSMKGTTNAKNPFSKADHKLKFSYLEIPLLASFRFQLTPGFGLTVNAGSYFACMVNDLPTQLPDMRWFDSGAQLGLDFVFGQRFVVGAEAQYGFQKLAKTFSPPHLYNYALLLGYKF